MRDNARKSFVQAYNAQIAVDAHRQVIVAAEITQKTTDREQLLPMVQSVRMTTASIPKTVTADAGYWDTSSLRDAGLQGIQVLVSPDAQVQPPGVPLLPNAPKSPEAVRMREVLLSPVGKMLYCSRKATVEPVFGQIKEVRGLRRFRFRGLRRVECEWKLICATHNLLKLFRHRLLPVIA
ncbi:MAG TPA: transposase [Terriglobales bacterium]|nr:transposase [Terriglobales bacterium]